MPKILSQSLCQLLRNIVPMQPFLFERVAVSYRYRAVLYRLTIHRNTEGRADFQKQAFNATFSTD